MEIFAERIKKLRTIFDYSQQDLATRLHINQSQVAKWEKYGLEPSLTNLYETAKIFNVSTDYLLGLDDATLNLKNLIEKGTWIKYFIDNPKNEKVQQFKKECEFYELNHGNDIEFAKLNQKEKLVFFAKNAQTDTFQNIPHKEELNYNEILSAHALKNDIEIDKEFFKLLYEILPEHKKDTSEKSKSPCPNFFEVKEKILKYYEELQPYRGLLNHFC